MLYTKSSSRHTTRLCCRQKQRQSNRLNKPSHTPFALSKSKQCQSIIMFDLPDAKRVRRDDLLTRTSTSPSPSPPPDDSAVQNGHELLKKLLNLDDAFLTLSQPPKDETENSAGKDENEDEEQEFEFRLFSAPSAKAPVVPDDPTNDKTEATPTTQKLRIRLRSPTPVSARPGEGRFVKAFRGWEYYFTAPELYAAKGDAVADGNAAARKRQFEEVAVSGEELLGWAKMHWPGCHLPWRVIHLKRQHTKLPPASKDVPVYVVDPSPVTPSPKSRKKPGKKRRIQLRKRAAAAKVAQETEAEKRNRKNRERKIKRRQKAREAKAALAAANGTAGQSQDVAMTDDREDAASEAGGN